jgi:hypothetical protein
MVDLHLFLQLNILVLDILHDQRSLECAAQNVASLNECRLIQLQVPFECLLVILKHCNLQEPDEQPQVSMICNYASLLITLLMVLNPDFTFVYLMPILLDVRLQGRYDGVKGNHFLVFLGRVDPPERRLCGELCRQRFLPFIA